MKEIRFGIDTVVIVDDEDYDRVKSGSWVVHRKRLMKTETYRNGQQLLARVKKITVEFSNMIMNCPEGMEVDHINGNSLDNRKSNLRICTHSQNMKNRKPNKNNPWGFKGVAKRGKKFKAYITANKTFHYLGIFCTPEEAAVAYNTAAQKLHGEYARLNVIP